MSFKNKQGEVSWYVIALILALLVLVVSLFVIPKIRGYQNQTGTLTDACTVAGGTCSQGDTCTTGTRVAVVSCPDAGTKESPIKQICCKA